MSAIDKARRAEPCGTLSFGHTRHVFHNRLVEGREGRDFCDFRVATQQLLSLSTQQLLVVEASFQDWLGPLMLSLSLKSALPELLQATDLATR